MAERKTHPLIIGITGMNGAKKTLVTEMLAKHGMKAYTLSQVLRDELQSQGVTSSPLEYAKLARRLRAKSGNDILARLTLKRVEDRAPIVIDGIRSPAEMSYLRKRADRFFLVLVHASPETRFQRFYRRRHPFLSTRKQFDEQDQVNLKLGIGAVIAKADYVVVNETYAPVSLKEQVNQLFWFVVHQTGLCIDESGQVVI